MKRNEQHTPHLGTFAVESATAAAKSAAVERYGDIGR